MTTDSEVRCPRREIREDNAVAGEEVGDVVAVQAGRRIPKNIYTVPPCKNIVAQAAREKVITIPAIDDVVAAAACDLVVAVKPIDGVAGVVEV